ncbi:hypothetical protein TCAL_00402 [Tigriopus californicus]|uniref:Inositol-pentakisphosphate 2-kinase n=1 Tax=Tigriopus californicus TaxID=6832 RepID=A0A553NDJ1_TIGCA|nr:inositol-pentakisphosphate 2-kinase-like [Tigriopus californicus]TRY63503.1 hypothetical protein TCAL_00402 [Tigriopus californicus]|eukprot:TCALIF_00402-PA protein Name:"Similar to IPPK Inositol-pentakisphosphate 2-kinase (Homo sapiens)" AED:0.02 eAED:0.02 QI:0/-1/0/1/-1/1/1/0/440
MQSTNKALARSISVVAQPWTYRGEGGANLVIALSDEKSVLRFAKSKFVDKDVDGKIGEIAYFANTVMRPRLGSLFIRPLEIRIVDDLDFHNVRESVQPLRPPARLKKDMKSKKVIMSHDCTFLTPEYERNTQGDTISFEIKPKQGWHSLKASCSVDLCHRCLKQYAKLHKGEITSISKYCPLDLFSCDPLRMKRAIFDLFEFPCNRFKVFRNGGLIYTENIGTAPDVENELSQWLELDPHDSDAVDLMAALLCTALLSPLEETKEIDVMESLVSLDVSDSDRGQFCDTKSDPLPPNCILQRLLALQRQTEIGDNEAQIICDRLLNNIEDIEGLHQLVMWHPNNKLEHKLSPSEIEDVLQLQRFLLSVTAKDVSLLLTFREIQDLSQETFEHPVLHFRSVDKSFRLMLSVIDMDPKSVHRISSWVKRKESWLNAYFSSLKD